MKPSAAWWDLMGKKHTDTLYAVFNFLRMAVILSMAGLALFILLQFGITVWATVTSIKQKITPAAHGASYMGLGTSAVQVILRPMPLAGSLYELIAPMAPNATAEPLSIMEHMDQLVARQWSTVCGSIISIMGCLFGKLG